MASKLIFTALLFFVSTAKANLDEFQIQDVQKNKIEFKTSKVLVYFWATWCPDCKQGLRQKLPSLGGPDVTMLGVNTDATEDKVIDYLKTEKITLPSLVDRDKALRKKYSVFSVPTALVFKKDKGQYILSKTLVGADLDELRAELKNEIRKEPSHD